MKGWCLSWWEQDDRLKKNSRNREKKTAIRWLEETRTLIVERGIEGPEEGLIEQASWIMKWIKNLEERKAESDR